MSSASQIYALVTVLITVTCVAGQDSSSTSCPVNPNPRPPPRHAAYVPPINGYDQLNNVKMLDATGKRTVVTNSALTIYTETPLVGGNGCDFVGIDFVDFLKTTGSNLCTNPGFGTAAPQGVYTTLPLNLTTQFSSQTQPPPGLPFQGLAGGPTGAAQGPSAAATTSGARAPSAGVGRRLLQNGGAPSANCGASYNFTKSAKYPNYSYSVVPLSSTSVPGSYGLGTYTILGVAFANSGACSINWINLDRFLFILQITLPGLCQNAAKAPAPTG